MKTSRRVPEIAYYRVVVTRKDGTENVRARNVTLTTAEAVSIAVSHLGTVRIVRQSGIERPQ